MFNYVYLLFIVSINMCGIIINILQTMSDKYCMTPKLTESFFNKVRYMNTVELEKLQEEQCGWTSSPFHVGALIRYNFIFIDKYFFCTVCGHMLESNKFIDSDKYKEHSELCMESYLLKRNKVKVYGQKRVEYQIALFKERYDG